MVQHLLEMYNKKRNYRNRHRIYNRGAQMKKYLLPMLIFIFGFLYIFIIPTDPEWLKLTFKVIPMILIIMYAFNHMPSMKNSTHYLIIIGLFFSTIGDATLRWFVIGLTAFLIGHLFYIGAFRKVATVSMPKILSLIALVPFGVWMGFRLVQSLLSQGESPLIIPVLLYIFVILTMCFIAILTGNRYSIIGSVLFVISDAILAWNMFVAAISLSGIYVMTTYYGAQFFIATSMASIDKNNR